jgi:hypothetical protein
VAVEVDLLSFLKAGPEHFGEEVKQNVTFTPEQATKAQTVSRGVAVLFL